VQHRFRRAGGRGLSVRRDGSKSARPEAEKPHPAQGQAGQAADRPAKGSNRTKSSVRVRVEHIFGAQTNDMGGTLGRTTGLVRAEAKIGMKNLAYNMRRLCQLRRLNPNLA
jgi:IS5 family transposase